MRAVIFPRFDDDCNSTNGFVNGRAYPATREGFFGGWTVHLENGAERFICPDGYGGAHLQHTNGRTGYEFSARTAGHFEIRESRPHREGPA